MEMKPHFVEEEEEETRRRRKPTCKHYKANIQLFPHRELVFPNHIHKGLGLLDVMKGFSAL